MGCVIDHLQADHRVRVIQDFKDARGTRHHVEDTGIIRRMDLDWARQEIVLEWECAGTRTKLFFSLTAKEGPRNGRMRDFFALEERVSLPEDMPAARRRRRKPEIPEVVETPVTDPARYGEAVTRAWALAARRRFAEAGQQLALILEAPDPYGGILQQLAGDMVAMAEVHADDADGAVFSWAKEQATNLWYAWGSQATSGGEGTLRAESIRAAEERLARCDTQLG